MDYKRIWYACILLVVILTGCDHLKDRVYKSNAAPKKIAYLFLVDKIDSALINGLNYQFYGYLCDSTKKAITKKQPYGIGMVSFSVFSAQTYDSPILVSFSAAEHKRYQRTEKADRFLNDLIKLQKAGENIHEKSILNSLNHILEAIRDTSINYRVIVLSDLVENSGGAIVNSSSGQQHWQNGNFRFVNGDGDFEPIEFDEAKRQVGDTSSWINMHLIKMTQNGKQYKKCKVTWIIDRKPMMKLGV